MNIGMKQRAFLWCLLALGVVVAGTLQILSAGRIPLQTNLLALLPLTERNPVAEEALTRLTNVAGNRVIFLVTADQPIAATRYFARALRDTQAFKDVTAEIPPLDPAKLTRPYLQHRYSLLSGSDQTALSDSPDLEARLQRKLYAPFHFGLTLSPSEDPFGLTDAWLASLPLRELKLAPEDGLLVTHDTERTWGFVSASLRGSSYDGSQQEDAEAALLHAETALTHEYPESKILRTGTLFYATAARKTAEREVDLIGAGSLIGMLILLYLVFRSLRPLALGLLSVGFGIATAITVTVAVYGEMHLITLVFGASLIGEAIDYAVQYFAAHLGAGPGWEPMAGLRRIAAGLSLALATSLLGYASLLLAPFPALAQIALFALTGLSAAWLSVFLLLPALLVRPSQRDPEHIFALSQRFLRGWQNHVSRRHCLLLALLLIVAALPGWLKLTSNDDVRLLISRPASLVAQEDRIRQLTGFGNGNQFFLVEGETPDAVLAREEQLSRQLDTLVTQGAISAYQALSAFVPSAAQQGRNRTLWQEAVFADEARLKALFAQSGLRDDIAERQIVAFKAAAGNILHLDNWLQEPISMPFRHLWLGKTAKTYASIVVPQGVRDATQLSAVTSELTGVTLVDKADSVSRLFRDYRYWGAFWLLGAFVLVYSLLCLRYGGRQAAITLAPTGLSVALALGIFGYLGTPLTLFNLMALMLVLGVGVNYAIFLREGGVHAPATLAGVLLSAGTTLLSFGLLAFSSMPALSSFGLTLLVGVGIAVLLAPIVLSFSAVESACE